MKLKLILMMILVVMLQAGCAQFTARPPAEPYRDLNTYLHGNWVLLAESSSKNWYYDPESLEMDDDDTVSFWSYWANNANAIAAAKKLADAKKLNLKIESTKELGANNPSYNSTPKEESLEASTVNSEDVRLRSFLFDPEAIGPYLQKIGCSTNTQLSESLIDGSCDVDANPQGSRASVSSGSSDCWSYIKSKSAMAFIRTRICGRKFVVDNTSNYFLYQTGFLPIQADQSKVIKAGDVAPHPLSPAITYEVINNEYIVTDVKNNIREMKVATYFLDKKGAHDSDYIYRANCQEGTDSFSKLGQSRVAMQPVGDLTSLSGVAFNRICGDHGQYMQQVKNFHN